MSTLYPYQTKVTRLYHPDILPAGIVIEYSDLLFFAMSSCLQASQTALQNAQAFESDHFLDVVQTLLIVDPEDDYTVLNELKRHGFSVAQPLECLFVDAVIPADSPESIQP
jgi:hypothetical protein